MADPGSASPTTGRYPLLWYTSGTPIGVGQRDCAMERFLGFHAGPHGTGYRRIAQAVPLVTGGAVHTGMQLLGEWILEWQAANPLRRLLSVPDEVTAWAASEAAGRYEHKARTRGLELTKTDLDAATAIEQLILEQRTLIEALVWVYAIVRLPVMLSEYKLLNVEFEETPVLDCTCGLGDWVGMAEQHAMRGCQGIVHQGRSDYLWQAVGAPDVVYEEFKTKATPNYGWENAWEHSGQLLLNMEAASKRLGRDVTSAFIPVLYKGKRDRTNRDDKTSPKIQQSPLVYGWYDPGGLNRDGEWQARYKWFDDWGKGHTLPKTYTRQPVWNEEIPLPAVNPNGIVYRAGASRVENWVRGFILPIQYADLHKTLGPFPKPRTRIPLATASILAEEHLWRDRVTYLRSINAHSGHHPEVIALIPRSWNCTHWDGTPCQFKPVCMQDPGWENLETMGRYEIRAPHHVPEKAAIETLGVVFPDQDEDEDGGED